MSHCGSAPPLALANPGAQHVVARACIKRSHFGACCDTTTNDSTMATPAVISSMLLALIFSILDIEEEYYY